MYLESNFIKKLLGKIVTHTNDIGDLIESTGDYVYTPGFVLNEEFGIHIDNITILNGITKYRDLLGLKLINIEQAENKFIKFIFEENKFIIVDMSENGFGGFPEAIDITKKDGHRWIVRSGDVVEI